MSEKHELVHAVPRELISAGSGLGLDIGGSLIKFAFRQKEDKEIGTSNGLVSTSDTILLVSFPMTKLSDALEYVRQRADISRNGDEPATIYTTGTGIMKVEKQISAALNIKLVNLSEFDCYVSSFVYLAEHLSRAEFLEPFNGEATKEPLAQQKGLRDLHCIWTNGTMSRAQSVKGDFYNEAVRRVVERSKGDVNDGRPLAVAEPDMFPCLVVACGSAVMFNQVEADGSFQILGGLHPGGKAFLGMGNLMLGVKSFGELTALASRGDSSKVDELSGGPVADDSTELNDLYTAMNRNTSFVLYPFGKPAGADRESFKREDVARSLLNLLISDVVRSAQNFCHQRGLKRVFFIGGLCLDEFVRQAMTDKFVYWMLQQMIFNEMDYYVEFDFVRPGTYLGAVGCLLNSVHKFS